MRKLAAFVVALVAALGVVTVVEPAPKAHASTQVLWSVSFGNGIGRTYNVLSSTGWHVGGGDHNLYFQSDCNEVEYWGTHGAFYASNTVTSLRPCRELYQQDDNMVIYRSNGSVAWASNTVHNGTEAAVLLTNGCFNMYHLTGGWVWPERQLAGSFGTDLTTCHVQVA